MNLRTCAISAMLIAGISGCTTTRPTPPALTQLEIRAVLERQVADWNAGSIEKFMRGYHRSETIRFASGDEIRHGWQTVLDRYRARYGDRAAMGKLAFSDIEITVLSNEAALAFGRWRLERANGELHGLFTLLFLNTSDGWRIVHDHTSAADTK